MCHCFMDISPLCRFTPGRFAPKTFLPIILFSVYCLFNKTITITGEASRGELTKGRSVHKSLCFIVHFGRWFNKIDKWRHWFIRSEFFLLLLTGVKGFALSVDRLHYTVGRSWLVRSHQPMLTLSARCSVNCDSISRPEIVLLSFNLKRA